jgi:hypothetical protein
MLRHPRLRDPELGLDELSDLARGLLAIGEQIQDPASDRITENIEGVHIPENDTRGLYKSTVKCPAGCGTTGVRRRGVLTARQKYSGRAA